MNGNPMLKLEIDCFQMGELQESMEFATKYNIPGIVTHQGLSADACIIRGKLRGKFKIIIPIDWPKGENFGSLKFRNMTIDSFEGDAFEIVLSNNKSIQELKNEVKVCTDFIRNYLGPLPEIRFVIPPNKSELVALDEFTGLFASVRNPAYIRFGFACKAPVNRVNRDYNREVRQKLAENCGVPVKICGNINTIADVEEIKANLYSVSLSSAKAIYKEMMAEKEARRNSDTNARNLIDAKPE